MVATILVIAARVWFALYGRRDDDSEDAAEVRRTGTHRPGTLDLDRSDGPVAADEHPRAGRSPSRRRQQVLYEPVPEVTRRGLSTGGAFLVVLVGAYVVYAVVIMARMRG